MKLIFCRHGETAHNFEDKFQGISDSPLTQTGIEQAKKLNLYLRKEHIDEFIISPLPRVKQTYNVASKGLHAKLVITNNLLEMSYGNFEETPRRLIDKKLLEKREQNRFQFVHPGSFQGKAGESYAQLYKRIAHFLEELLEKEQAENKTIVIIAHQGVMVCIRKFFLSLSDAEAGVLRVPNDEVFVVTKQSDAPIACSIEKIR